MEIKASLKVFLLNGAIILALGCGASSERIHAAIRENDFERMQSILGASPRSVNASDGDGATPLHLAASLGFAEAAKVLLVSGAKVEAKDQEGQTPLYYAARYGHQEIVELLLAHQADVNGKDNKGETALVVARKWGHGATVELLMTHNALDEQSPKFGKGVLTVASKVAPTITKGNSPNEGKPSETSVAQEAKSSELQSCGCGGSK